MGIAPFVVVPGNDLEKSFLAFEVILHGREGIVDGRTVIVDKVRRDKFLLRILKNPLQIGFSIILGWVIVFVSSFLQPPLNEAMYWILPLLGVSLIVLGFIEKERVISPRRAKILLQIGVVVTLIWVMLFIQSEGPYDLGLPKIYIPIGYTPDGVPISTPLPIIIILALPVLGLILLVMGIVLNRLKKS